MAPTVKPASPLFLGLELATDQLRATLVDEHLDLVGVESCDFDSDLPDYGSASSSLYSRSHAHIMYKS
jgi:xylulokinase